MSGTKKVVLAKPADWDAWIFFVRTQATNSRIWDLVNPDLTVRPIALQEPTEPEYDIPDDDSLFHKFGNEACKARQGGVQGNTSQVRNNQKRCVVTLSSSSKIPVRLTKSCTFRMKSHFQGTFLDHCRGALHPVMRHAVLSEQK